MVQIAKILNNFGNEFFVPLHKAQEMQLWGDIKSFEIVEVKDAGKNTEKPETEAEFNRRAKK